jgi:UDP-glucose 4-epimerase
MKALVTGGAGFIGSHVVDDLMARGVEVVVLDDLSGGFVENVTGGARFIQGSVLDVALIKQLFRDESFDYVFHLAAYAAEGLSHFIRRFNYENNLVGSINLINASVLNGIKCFVFTSSIAVYGKNQLPMTESLQPHPEDPYGVSKYAVELDLAAAHDMFGLNYVVFRPHNVYGERQNIGDKYRNVLGIFMNNLMAGKPMTIFGDGSQTRAFSYIGDVAPIIAQSVTRQECMNQVYNIGADAWCSVKELALIVAGAFGVEACIQYLPERNEVKHAYASHDKIRSIEVLLEMTTKVSLDEGVRRMADWARKRGPQQSKPFANIEVAKNVPVGWC